MHTFSLTGCFPGRPPPQVWFDPPQSLSAKYRLAQQLGLRGVGMWNLECVDYESQDAEVAAQTQAMWAAMQL